LTPPREVAFPEPRVSIGIPVYNGAAYLEEALRSVRAQTLADVETLVPDNGSTDDSALDTIASLSTPRGGRSADPRIGVERQLENRGAPWSSSDHQPEPLPRRARGSAEISRLRLEVRSS